MVTAVNQPGGVSIATPGATSWRGNSRLRLANGPGDVFSASAIAQGRVISSSKAQRTSNGYVLSASFSASDRAQTYSVLVYRNGVLQRQLRRQRISVGPRNPLARHREPSSSSAFPGRGRMAWPHFIVDQGGACTWIYRMAGGSDRAITLAGKSLVGDEIRFVEEVNPSGGVSVSCFDGLVFEGDIEQSIFTFRGRSVARPPFRLAIGSDREPVRRSHSPRGDDHAWPLRSLHVRVRCRMCPRESSPAAVERHRLFLLRGGGWGRNDGQ